ncbi:MAG: hypothetical protein Q4G39_07645 [Brachymonas sp.]|nr:hypothetical protein [Brachymonas sp.]
MKQPTRRRGIRLALLPLALAAFSQTACAQPAAARGYRDTQVSGPVAQVRIIDRETGRALPVYRHRGEYWVAGRPGARYGISIQGYPQPTYGRIEAVVAVDGVNVITGRTASLRHTGYVLHTGQWHTITGWRKNDAEVAAFHFTALPNSYAARTGRPDNVGVIGVALYREKAVPQVPPPWREVQPMEDDSYGGGWRQGNAASSSAPARAESMQRAPAAPAAKSMPQQDVSRLGTGHGARENSAVSYTTFERRSSNPDQVVTIRYDSHENLVRMGVIPQRPSREPVRPQPFPQTPPRQYVPDPPAW